MKEDDTQQSRTRKLEKQSVFFQYPDEYYNYALQWCSYPHWTIEETANLLSGCVPHREMLLRGEEHARLDQEVLATENRIRAALYGDLKVVKSQKYFGKTYLISSQIFAWAKRVGIQIPPDLLKAEHIISHKHQGDGYTTPCLEAAKWVLETFWEHANLREPPTAGEIIQALLQQFPELTGVECDLVEKITRHPLARPAD